MHNLQNLHLQLHAGRVSLCWMAVAVAGMPHKAARSALGQPVLTEQGPDRLALAQRG